MNRAQRRAAKRKGGLRKVHGSIQEINAQAEKLGMQPIIQENEWDGTFRMDPEIAPILREVIAEHDEKHPEMPR